MPKNIPTPTHPLSEHPLAAFDAYPDCALPRSHPAYIVTVLLEASLRQCQEYVQGRLLDVGCGRKPYKKNYFSRATEYIGTDYLSDRSEPDVVCSALDLPFPEASFDTVVSTEVLEHVPEPLRALREMRRVIKPEGRLILSTPMYWPRHEVPYDYFRYPYDGLLHLLKESDWEVVRLFNRGHGWALVGQVLNQLAPHVLQSRPMVWLLNTFFLWCDTHRQNDKMTMGWTVVARPIKRSTV